MNCRDLQQTLDEHKYAHGTQWTLEISKKELMMMMTLQRFDFFHNFSMIHLPSINAEWIFVKFACVFVSFLRYQAASIKASCIVSFNWVST